MWSFKNILIILFFLPLPILASVDSAIVLKEVNVHGFRSEEKATGLKHEQQDSLSKIFNRFTNLTTFLSGRNLYLKNYGPSQLSVLTMRGGSSYHTGILWNGMNFVDPMTGTADFSLLKPFLFDDITLQYGGSSSLTGSGNLSGSVLLSERKKYNSGWTGSFGTSYATIGNTMFNGHLAFGSKKTFTIIRAFTENALNQYHYIREKTEEIQKASHSVQRGLTFNHAYKTGNKSVLDLTGWLQHANRQIAPALYQSDNDARQIDENYRMAISYKITGIHSLNIRTAYFYDRLFYNDNDLQDPSKSLTRTILTEADFRHSISSIHFAGVMVNYTTTNATTADYGTVRKADRKWINLYYNYKSKNGKLDGALSIRKEFFTLANSNSPLVFTAGMEQHHFLFNSRISFSRLHRNPTLNDLYWTPGGNPALKPESGYGMEVGTNFNAGNLFFDQSSKSNLLLDVTFYSRTINNWIQWIPVNGSLWSPQNLEQVHSRGMETQLQYYYTAQKFSIKGEANFAYTLSTKEKSSIRNDASLHRQLIYVPVYSAGGNMTLSYSAISIRITHQYSSYRYTTSDHSYYLKPFQLTNIYAAVNLNVHKKPVQLFAMADNVFNSNYNLVYNRPQPLKNFQFGIILNLNAH